MMSFVCDEDHIPLQDLSVIKDGFENFEVKEKILISGNTFDAINKLEANIDSERLLSILPEKKNDFIVYINHEFFFIYRKVGNHIMTIGFTVEGISKKGRLSSGDFFYYLIDFNTKTGICHSNFSGTPDGKESLEKCVSLVNKTLIYLFIGDIRTVFLKPKGRLKFGRKVLKNKSNHGFWIADSKWKIRYRVGGFKVKGHFRVQPYGKGRKKYKLIWIEEFSKKGYNTKAKVEKFRES